jgi:hypothetical protein
MRDFSWIIDRTNLWDAFGVGSYGLLLAFIESLVVFFLVALLGFLISPKWGEDRRIALLSVLSLVTALWAVIDQAYFLSWISIPPPFISFLVQSAHPIRYIYAFLTPLIALTAFAPAYLILKLDKGFHAAREVIDRLSLLTMFYLFLDIAGVIIVIIRNILGTQNG